MRCLLSVGLSLLLAGCGGGVSDRPAIVPVSGVVKFKGVPQEGATVTFSTASSPRTSIGVCNAAGEYKLSTFDTDDGAVAGSNVVTITKKVTPDDAPMNPEDYMKKMQAGGNSGAPPTKDLANMLPAKYANPAESGLKRDVIAGESNVFTFDLTE